MPQYWQKIRAEFFLWLFHVTLFAYLPDDPRNPDDIASQHWWCSRIMILQILPDLHLCNICDSIDACNVLFTLLRGPISHLQIDLTLHWWLSRLLCIWSSPIPIYIINGLQHDPTHFSLHTFVTFVLHSYHKLSCTRCSIDHD